MRTEIFLGMAMCLGLSAQTVTSVQNPASNILAGLPNYGIAQGSIFVVYGSGLGPATLAAAAERYSTSLAGTSMQVFTGDLFHSYSPYIIYTSATQVAAIMPSNVPVASVASIQVTYNGKAGAVFNTAVVANNFGISTMNETGGGPAIVTYPTSTAPFFGLLSNSNAGMPGNTYTIWGTGLGAATGGNSDTGISVYGNVGPDVQVWVGGVLAAVTYYGRSPGSGPGLDQINFTIPSGLAGCNVSLVVQTGLLVSNTTTIPIAPGGGACSDAANPLGGAISAVLAKGAAKIGLLNMEQNVAQYATAEVPSVGFQTDIWSTMTKVQVSATFLGYPAGSWAYLRPASLPSVGSCTVSTNGAAWLAEVGDAGSISVTPPSAASSVLTEGDPGIYSGTLAGLSPGNYMINGSGGKNVGEFTVSVPATNSFVWTNQNSVSQSQPLPVTTLGNAIIRSQGQTIAWTGAAPNSYVYISGNSSAAFGSTTGASFFCTAPALAGQFTIPASVLLALPVTQVSARFFLPIPDSQLSVGNTTYPVTFTASGLDAGYATVTNSSTVYVAYQ